MVGDLGEASLLESPVKVKKSALQKDIAEKQFQRELRLQVLYKAAEREASATVAEPTEKKRAWLINQDGRTVSTKRKQTTERRPPKTIFDAEATLGLVVDISHDFTMGRAEKLREQQQTPMEQPVEESTATALLADLGDARSQLASHMARERLNASTGHTQQELEGRVPETAAELDQELAWLARKTETTRHEARQEESAVRGRAKQRGKALTAQELALDERVLAARRKHSRYSRRQVALMRLRQPGAKFGPPLPADEQVAAAPEASMVAAVDDAPTDGGGTLDVLLGSLSPGEMGADPLTISSIRMEQQQRTKAERGTVIKSGGFAGGARGATYNAGAISMLQRAYERRHAEAAAKDAAGASSVDGDNTLSPAAAHVVSKFHRRGSLNGRKGRRSGGGGDGGSPSSPKGRVGRRPSLLGMIGLDTSAADSIDATDAPPAPAEAGESSTLMATVGRRMSSSFGRRLSNAVGSTRALNEVRTRWSSQLRHARHALELRGVRDCVRILRETVASAAIEARSLAPPTPPLGVSSDASTLSNMQHTFNLERASRLSDVLDLMRDDPRRRFVLGRERYEEEVAASATKRLVELEAIESSHEDGSVEATFLSKQEINRLCARDVLADADELLNENATSNARADRLVATLQASGYDEEQISLLLTAACTHEPAAVQQAFSVYDVDGAGVIEREPLIRSMQPYAEALGADGSACRQALSESAALRGVVAYNEFATLLRSCALVAPQRVEVSDGRGGHADGSSKSFAMSFSRRRKKGPHDATYDMAAQNRAERALFRRVARKQRRACELLKERMELAGYSHANILAVCMAMFVSQERAVLLPAWRVFDPMGSGTLSLREVQAAFALFGEGAIEALDLQGEFARLDKDDSGFLEIAEFGALLHRLAALAKGDQITTDADNGVLGAAKLEARLLGALDGTTYRAMPLGARGFARRLFASMRQLGFAPDQTALVLRAIYHPDPVEQAEATRVAWLLLGGVDWPATRDVDAETLARVESRYEDRKRAAKREQQEEERARRAARGAPTDAPEENMEEEEAAGGERRGWQKLRARRFGGMVAAAMESAAEDARIQRRQRPPILSVGAAPRKTEEPFTEWSNIALDEYERLVSTLGDWQQDEEMRRGREELKRLFKVLDASAADGAADGAADERAKPHATSVLGQALAGENGGVVGGAEGSFISSAGAGDDISKLSPSDLHGLLVMLLGKRDAPTLHLHTNASEAARQQRRLAEAVRVAMTDAPLGLVDECVYTIAEKIRQQQRLADEAAGLVRVDLARFEELLRGLRPLAPGEREGDAELLALTRKQGAGAEAAVVVVGAPVDRRPNWMATAEKPKGDDGSQQRKRQQSTWGQHAAQASAIGLAATRAFDLQKNLVGDGRLDVVGSLDDETKALIPVTHIPTIRLVLSNLRTAGFPREESNVLLRALYSFADPVDGAAMREEAWRLLCDYRVHLRDAADALASEVGEFRTEAQRFRLPGIAALRDGDGQAASEKLEKRDDISRLNANDLHALLVVLLGHDHAPPPPEYLSLPGERRALQRELARQVRDAMADAPLGLIDEAMALIGEGLRAQQKAADADGGLREDEFQFVVSLLGEHLSEGQRNAIFAVVDFTEEQMVPFEEVERILRFMYGAHHSFGGSIKDNEAKARAIDREVEGVGVETAFLADAGRAVGGALAWVVGRVQEILPKDQL